MPRRPLLLAATLLATTSCAEPAIAPDPDGDPTALPTLAVTPTTAPPGAPLTISGIAAADLTGPLTLTIDGQPSAVIPTSALGTAPGTEDDDRGDPNTLRTTVPLFVTADGPTGSGAGAAATILDLPTGPVDVTLLDGDTPIAELAAGFTVAPRPTAPDALENTAAALADITASLHTMATLIEPDPSVSRGFATAAVAALDALLTGDSEHSLASQLALLDEAGPEEKAFVESWIAGSGVLAYLQTVAELAKATASAMEEPVELTPADLTPGEQVAIRRHAAAPSLTPTALTEFELVRRMQYYAMVRDFGQHVIAQTNQEWGEWTGAFSLLTGLVVDVPFVGTVSAALGVANFALNNVALAYLPARVETFEVRLGQDWVFSGDVADAEVWLVARNAPLPITVLDLTDLILTAIGFGSSHDRESIRGLIATMVDTFLTAYRQYLSNYGQTHAGDWTAFDAASIPSMSWTARITNTLYARPRSFTEEVIDSAGSGILAWRAGVEAEGEGRIFASMQTGPDVVSVLTIPGYTYGYGPFGEDVLDTEVVSVQVGAPLVMRASMDPTISAGGVNGLEVRAGTLDALSDTVWQEGLEVTLSATGGEVDPATGTTDADGRFDTFVTLGEASDSVRVAATVTAASGFAVDTVLVARADESTLVIDADLPRLMVGGSTERLYIGVERRLAGSTGTDEEPFAEITLQVTGGTAAEASGTADDEGFWSTDVTLAAEADEMTVRIVATSLDGLVGDTTLTAANLDSQPLAMTSHAFRAWLNTSGTNGPNYRLYRDNFHDLLGLSAGGSWSYPAMGSREGKLCNLTTDFIASSLVELDPETGVMTRWTSSSETLIDGEAEGLTGTDDPACRGDTQVQNTLRFTIHEGSWRVTWTGTLEGSARDTHQNWESETFFRDPHDDVLEAPPEVDIDGSVVLEPGEYSVYVRTVTAGTVRHGLETVDASGGHTVTVTFERVNQ